MNKNEAIQKLEALKKRTEKLEELHTASPDFQKWLRATEIAIKRIFGEKSRNLQDFQAIRYSTKATGMIMLTSVVKQAYKAGIEKAIVLIESFVEEIDEYWSMDETNEYREAKPERTVSELSSIAKIELLINRFHQVARQLRARYSDRQTIEIKDEYDVQYLFHALLKIYFDDVRPEEYTPSYAGSASRVDFLLKSEQVVIEIKKTRKGLEAKKVGEELIIDSQKYQAHQDCGQLICFVYDPECRIANPRGIENDLTKKINGIPVSVFIRPQ